MSSTAPHKFCHLERSERSTGSNPDVEDPYSTVLRTSSTQAVAKPTQDDTQKEEEGFSAFPTKNEGADLLVQPTALQNGFEFTD